MTQIVYDGKYLFADQKIYTDGLAAGEGVKLLTTKVPKATLHYAFCGPFVNCAIGEKVVESNFDPSVMDLARKRFKEEELSNYFGGIVVEVPESKNYTPNPTHKVYLANYTGDLCLCKTGSFLVVGSLEQTIRDVYRTVNKFWNKDAVKTEDIIRFAVDGTSQDQQGFMLSRINLRTGVYEEV